MSYKMVPQKNLVEEGMEACAIMGNNSTARFGLTKIHLLPMHRRTDIVKTYLFWGSVRWLNDSAFVFCAADCPFESEPNPTSADARGEVTDCNAGCQEVNRCSTRGRSQGTYIAFAFVKANSAVLKTTKNIPLLMRTSMHMQGNYIFNRY